MVATMAARRPDRAYLQEVDAPSRSFREVDAAGRAWARALRRADVDTGDTIMLFTPTAAVTVEAWLGIARAGATEVPVNTGLRGRLLHYVLADAGAPVAIVHSRWLDRFTDLPPEVTATLRLVVVLDPRPDLPTRAKGGVRLVPVDEFLDAGQDDSDEAAAEPALDRSSIASVLYTSGTTGPSKGVNVTWAQLSETARGSMPASERGDDDVYYNPLPLYHIGGKFAVLRQAALGSTAVLRDGFDTEHFWDDIRRYRASTTLLLGATANFIYRQPEQPDDANTPLTDVLMIPLITELADFRRRFAVRVGTTFNMTELSAPLTSGWEPANTRTCGRVRDGYECRIVDDDGNEVGPDSVGELVVRATDPAVLNAGYRNMPEATQQAWRGGWFHTGDAFCRDADGNFYFVDRIKDAIRRRGENISSLELEAEVLAHPDVLECAAVAVPSEWGEDEVKVVVVPRPGREASPPQIAEFLVPRVAAFMVPRYVEIVAELPKTATQKIQKNVLRDAGITPATWDRGTTRRSAAPAGNGGTR